VVLPFATLTVVEEQDHVAVEDGRDPVRDGDDRRLRELLPKRLLDQVVRRRVHRSGGLVQDENLAPLQDHPAEAYELTLTHAPVLAVLYHCNPTEQIERGLQNIFHQEHARLLPWFFFCFWIGN
jgi:hypothetical protein